MFFLHWIEVRPPSGRNDRSQSRHLAASGSAPSGAYTVRHPILAGRERNSTKHNLTYTGPHVPTLNLPPVALVVNPPVPFTAQSVIRGRRTLSPTALAGTLFSPNGKIKKVHTCPAANCGSAFKRSEHLKRHYRAVHVGSKRKCSGHIFRWIYPELMGRSFFRISQLILANGRAATRLSLDETIFNSM